MTEEEKAKEIREHPELHQHTFDALTSCCMTKGALSLYLMDAHEGLMGTNGGRGCDVTSGPCACGAWHR